MTFARFVVEDAVHTLLVEHISDGQLQGFDLQQAFPGQHPITVQRQNANAQSMILKPQDVIRQAFISAAQTYHRGDESVRLLPSGMIPAGTLILSGTPGGVIFKPLNAWTPLLYIAPDDQVITAANFLGHLDNTVERAQAQGRRGDPGSKMN